MSKITSVNRGGKTVQVKVRNVTRSMTTATLLAQLPRGSRLLGFELSGVASNAGTTATLSVGKTTASNEYVNGVSVLAGGQGNGVQNLVGVPGSVGALIGYQPQSDSQIYALYAETGTASSTGSWKLFIYYTTGNDLDDDSGDRGA